MDHLGNNFVLLAINTDIPDQIDIEGIKVRSVSLDSADDPTGALAERYLGSETQGVYLIRPDQHVAARGRVYREDALKAALLKACGKN